MAGAAAKAREAAAMKTARPETKVDEGAGIGTYCASG